ncbi:unnamed protein product [Owenia fusiformis]|nr:unnamed protein product [Owenia fusiformis]
MFLHEQFLTPSPDEEIIQRRSSRLGNKTPADVTQRLVFDDNEVVTDTPPKTPKMSPRKRLVLTPTKSNPNSPAKCIACTPKRQRMIRKKRGIPLTTELSGLSKDQVVFLLGTIVSSHPELEEEVRDLLPAPDLRPLEENLRYLRKNIYKAIPDRKFGSMSRDSPSFKRVKTHLETFKRTLTDQGKELLHAQQWEASIDYSLLAWKYVSELPDWDYESHKQIKIQCYKNMAAQCMSALKKSTLEKEYYHSIKPKIESASKIYAEIGLCLPQIDKILETLQ